MAKIINKPYLFFWGLIPLIILIALFSKEETISINVHDVYVVILKLHFYLLLSFFLLIIGFGYWMVLKLKKSLLRIFSFLHIGSTLLGIILFLVVSYIIDYNLKGDNRLLENLSIIKELQTISVLLIIFGQIFYPFNILISLFRNKSND